MVIVNQEKLGDEVSLVKYNQLIQEAREQIPKSANFVLEFQFQKNIDFVNPLFLIALLNLYEEILRDYPEQDIRVVLNLKSLNKKPQIYILTFLTQYIDCQQLEVFTQHVTNIFATAKTNLIIFSDYQEDNRTLLFDTQSYHFLPIIKIGNNNFNDNFVGREYWITKDGKSKQQHNQSRKIFYKSLQLETIEKGAYKNKSEKVWKDIFETYLGLTSNGAYITSKFQDIFREMVENIEKHVHGANGYISFYKDTHYKTHNQFEFIIADDYKQGFLHKYFETIMQEQKDELNEKVKEDYQKIIDDFINENYEKVLKNIFDLNYVLSTQKERMTKHFGLPLLLKMIVKFEQLSLEKYQKDNFVSLKIYLNFDEKSFLIIYENGVANVIPLENNSIRGTYFHFSFPEKLYLDNPQEVTKVPYTVSIKHYKKLLEQNTNITIQNTLEKSQYYLDFEDLKNKIAPDKMKESVIVDYTSCNETSDFLRSLYSYGFVYELKDILVVNYPIEEEIEYLKLLCQTSDLSKICNIAFLNKNYPQILLITGNSESELFDINQMLSQNYNYNKRNFLSDTLNSDNKTVEIDSNLFFKNKENRLVFLPFELFLPNPTNENELLYTLMLDNFLELKENHEDIHLDLRLKENNLHIKKFYYLKYIFENSQWVKLMSFDLSKKIKKNYPDFKDIIFVGIEKYASSFISELEYLLDTKLQSYIVNDLNNTSIIKQFDSFKKLNISKTFIFIRPSVFESNIDTLTEGLKTCDKYTLVQLTKDGTDLRQWITTYNKNLQNVLELATDCTMCVPMSSFDQPLYEIAKDKYNIKDLYRTLDTYIKNDKFFKVTWKDAIYFPHISRNTNDYLYYIRTTQFLRNNKDDIKNYFEHEIKFERDDKIPVILTSAHNTNAEFVALINEIIFENDAIIHNLSLSNKEQGYFSIENLMSTYQEKEDYYSFYFVDDALSSGEAFKYIYSVLNSFFKDNFQGLFTLIDRTNDKDLNLMSSFYQDKSFYSYLKINIHPIKTGFEDCYLCERKKTFEKIARDSSLVTIKHTFQEKAKDLAKKNACEIEYEQLEPITNLKNYLRISSTEYIYQYIDEFNTIDDIDTQFKKYYKLVQSYFSKFYINGKIITKEIDNFLKVEAKIAFLKSLAFPKIYFFKSLRKNIHTYIYKEIRKFTDINQGAKNILIQPLLDEGDFKLLKQYELEKLAEYYTNKKRTNMNYFSFLLSLGSYLGINHILSYEVIVYYYNLTLEIKKDENYEYKNLLNAYPIAVKQLTSYSQEKSKYFELELGKFSKDYPFEYTRIFSRIFGLFVENTTDLKIDENIFESITKKQSIDEKIITFQNKLKEVISIDIKSICIDLNENIDNPLLVDVLNKYQEVAKESTEEIMYKSAFVKTDINDKDIVIEYRKEEDENKKYNIWCNYYKEMKTYIRITRSNDKLTPIGVIVIEHTNNNLNEHLKISRLVLAYQNIIDKLFQDHNMLSAMRSKYDELVEQKHMEDKNIQFLIEKSSHGAIKNARQCIQNFEGSDLTFLNLWFTYCNLVMGRMYMLGINKYETVKKTSYGKCITNEEMQKLFFMYDEAYNDITFESNESVDWTIINDFNIDPLHIKIFLTLFINNAIDYSNTPCSISINLTKTYIEIINTNTLKNEINIEEIKEIMNTNPVELIENNESNKAKYGITLYTINQFLQYYGHKIEADFQNNIFKLRITFKEKI